MTQLEILLLVARELNQLRINYMLTGAYAVSFYGKPRTTHDIDLNVEVSLSDVERVCKAFEDSFYVSKEMIEDAIKHQLMFNLIHNETQTKVDFWIVKETEFDKERFGRRIKAEIHGVPAFMPTAEDLIITKLDWYKQSDTQKHYDDVVGIFEIQKGKLDVDYIKKWAKQFTFEDIVENILKKAQ